MATAISGLILATITTTSMIQSSATINRHLAQFWVLADNPAGLNTDLIYGTYRAREVRDQLQL